MSAHPHQRQTPSKSLLLPEMIAKLAFVEATQQYSSSSFLPAQHYSKNNNNKNTTTNKQINNGVSASDENQNVSGIQNCVKVCKEITENWKDENNYMMNVNTSNNKSRSKNHHFIVVAFNKNMETICDIFRSASIPVLQNMTKLKYFERCNHNTNNTAHQNNNNSNNNNHHATIVSNSNNEHFLYFSKLFNHQMVLLSSCMKLLLEMMNHFVNNNTNNYWNDDENDEESEDSNKFLRLSLFERILKFCNMLSTELLMNQNDEETNNKKESSSALSLPFIHQVLHLELEKNMKISLKCCEGLLLSSSSSNIFSVKDDRHQNDYDDDDDDTPSPIIRLLNEISNHVETMVESILETSRSKKKMMMNREFTHFVLEILHQVTFLSKELETTSKHTVYTSPKRRTLMPCEIVFFQQDYRLYTLFSRHEFIALIAEGGNLARTNRLIQYLIRFEEMRNNRSSSSRCVGHTSLNNNSNNNNKMMINEDVNNDDDNDDDATSNNNEDETSNNSSSSSDSSSSFDESSSVISFSSEQVDELLKKQTSYNEAEIRLLKSVAHDLRRQKAELQQELKKSAVVVTN